jgi:hypothetical protein
LSGESEAALAALFAHLKAWPRDVLVLGATAFTNGLIGNSGSAGQKRAVLELLDNLAPSYGDDWWFTAHHGMALSESGVPRDRRSIARSPKTRRTPGRRTPVRIYGMRRAIPTRPAPS